MLGFQIGEGEAQIGFLIGTEHPAGHAQHVMNVGREVRPAR